MSEGVGAVAVYGIGNILTGDDGVGPFFVDWFKKRHPELVDGVEVEDLGTPGFDLLPFLSRRKLVVIVDSVRVPDAVAGTVVVLSPEDLAAAGRQRANAHDPVLVDALGTLELAGEAPEKVVIVGVVPGCTDTGIGLSEAVRASFEVVENAVLECLREAGVLG